MSSLILHQAPWVVPVSAPSIADGAVAVKSGTIVEAGPCRELKNKYPGATIQEHAGTALIPALINAHIHLELSHLPIPLLRPDVDGFIDWIETLLTLREQRGAVGETVENEARKILHQQYEQGVIALGDIGNTDIGAQLGQQHPVRVIHFHEHLGRSAKTRRTILELIQTAPKDKILTAHAPYSTHEELIRKLKERARHNNQPFSIHAAEPPSETNLLCSGTGELYEFLKGRKFIDDAYKPPAARIEPGAIHYLHSLGVLDARTICVHCVHVSPREIQILAQAGAKVCLCPGSNRYLKVGKAPAALYLHDNILPALGTDSLASNPELSLWREMQILHEDHPEINPADILAMATLAGAQALGLDNEYGTLAPGKSGRFLSIPLAVQVQDETKLHEALVNNAQQPTWVLPQ